MFKRLKSAVGKKKTEGLSRNVIQASGACAGTSSIFFSCIVIKSCSQRKRFDVDLVGAFHPQQKWLLRTHND